MPLHAEPVDESVVRQLAVVADVDPRSVVRRLAGLPVRGRVGRRIDTAIAQHLGVTVPSVREAK